MVFLVKENGKVRAFYSENEMKSAGFKKADQTVTEEKYNSNGCYARIIGGNIIVGKTDKEKAAEEKQEKIDGYMSELAELDRQAGAGRFIRDTSIAYAKKNGMDNGKGYENLVEIEARADEIRENLDALINE
jgi:hypothetical protein